MRNKVNIKSLIPIIICWGFIPLIVRMKPYITGFSKFDWFGDEANGQVDFFLIYKSYAIILISIIMLLIVANKWYRSSHAHKKMKFEPAFYCLIIYFAFAFGSFLFSQHKYYVSNGSYEVFESIWVIIGYLIICYYTYLNVNSESELNKLILWSGIGFAILGLIGISQFLGVDYFQTMIGRKLMTPRANWDTINDISFTFDPGVVYGTLYNPDWVGFYTNIILPIMLVMVYWEKTLWKKIVYAFIAIEMVICLIGSQALGGYIGLLGAIVVTMIVLLTRNKKSLILLGVLSVAGIISLTLFLNHTSYGESVKLAFTGTNKGYDNFAIKQIDTNDEDIVFHLSQNNENYEIHITYVVNEGDYVEVFCTDADGNEIATTLNEEDRIGYIVDDSKYLGCIITPLYIEDEPGIRVSIDGKDWYFSNHIDGTYYLYNSVAKYVKMHPIKDALIFNNDGFTNRGVIWNHTIPLLSKSIIFGTGANTFVLEYPQDDYIYKAYMNMQNNYDVKPHNWYLQQWLEEGFFALLAFLTFYGIYMYQFIRYYRKCSLKEPLNLMGIALFVGVTAYVICAIVNDSNVNTAPVFWVAIGLGYAVNNMIQKKKEEI